ncbi:MAG TPA: multiheme c-type cytochrome [Pirellulales bacterium]
MSRRSASINRFMAAMVVATIAVLVQAAGSGEQAVGVPALAGRDRLKAGLQPELNVTQYKGADYCSGCHSPSADNKLPRDWVTLDEFATWEKRDKHRHAFDALTCPRAKQIERLMGLPADKPATKDERCLACHSIDLSHGEQGKLLGEAGAERREAAIAQGVSCEVCHGASSLWFGPHAEPAQWRDRAADRRDGKLYAEYGMTNLRDPVTRTELCLSCHLGNISAGRFVTHEMYAAGHPPLQAFEMETFLERMPRHWRLDSERKADATAETDHKKRAAAEKILELDGYQAFARSQSALIEGLVALRASIKQLADQADPSLLSPGDSNPRLGLAEFGLYDCAACHHELKLPSERQLRGYLGAAPGRPPLKYWSLPLARVASGARGPAADLDAILAPLHASMRRRSFGDSATVHKAATEAISHLDSAIAELKGSLKQKPLDSKAAVQLARQLCDLGAKTPLELDSAQVLVGVLDAVATELKDQQSLAPAAASALDDLKHSVALDLPSTAFSCEPHESSIESTAPDAFDPFQFAIKLKALAALLAPM